MECSNRALGRYAREARYRPLTDIHSLETRSTKVFKGESMDITFREADVRWVHHPHNDALVISLQIGTKNVYRAIVDNRDKMIVPPSKEIRVHYFVEHESEYFTRPTPTTLFLKNIPKIELLEDEVLLKNDGVQEDFNGEQLEGRVEAL
ncbi:hypothetical protein AgCh_016520 [Apium graveolens]